MYNDKRVDVKHSPRKKTNQETSGENGQRFADAFAEGSAEHHLLLRITQIRIDERAAIAEDQTVSPADEAEQANQFLGRRSERNDVGRIEGLDALDCGGSGAAEGRMWIRLLLKGAFQGGGQEEIAALKIRQREVFAKVRWRSGGDALDELVEIGAGVRGADGTVPDSAVEIILELRRRSAIKEKSTDAGGLKAPGEFDARGPAMKMGLINTRATGIANGHASFSE
jgi:hypothetical protein